MFEGSYPNLRHLRLVLLIFEGASLRSAARQMNVTQPAATLSLAAMENLYGVSFFDRTGRGLLPTKFGEILHRRAARCVNLLTRALSSTTQLVADDPEFKRLLGQITISHMRALAGMLDQGSFRAAAGAIGIQSVSVQRSLAQMENIIGRPLTERYRATTRLNDLGQNIASLFYLALVELHALTIQIQEEEGQPAGTVSVGTVRVTAANLIPEAINKLTKAVPEARFRVYGEDYERMIEALRIGRIDYFCATLRPNLPPELTGEIVGRTRLRVLCGPSHPLAEKAGVTVDEIAGCRWIGTPQTSVSASRFRAIFEAAAIATPQLHVETVSFEVVRTLLLSGNYVSALTTSGLPDERSLAGLLALDVAIPDAQNPIWLLWRRDWHPTRLQSLFAEILRESAHRSDHAGACPER